MAKPPPRRRKATNRAAPWMLPCGVLVVASAVVIVAWGFTMQPTRADEPTKESPAPLPEHATRAGEQRVVLTEKRFSEGATPLPQASGDAQHSCVDRSPSATCAAMVAQGHCSTSRGVRTTLSGELRESSAHALEAGTRGRALRTAGRRGSGLDGGQLRGVV